jgi:hypothetical protein
MDLLKKRVFLILYITSEIFLLQGCFRTLAFLKRADCSFATAVPLFNSVTFRKRRTLIIYIFRSERRMPKCTCYWKHSVWQVRKLKRNPKPNQTERKIRFTSWTNLLYRHQSKMSVKSVLQRTVNIKEENS